MRDPNFSRKVWEGGKGVMIDRRCLGELPAQKLNAITGISGKANDD
jgi:hypothetical protein